MNGREKEYRQIEHIMKVNYGFLCIFFSLQGESRMGALFFAASSRARSGTEESFLESNYSYWHCMKCNEVDTCQKFTKFLFFYNFCVWLFDIKIFVNAYEMNRKRINFK